MKNAVIIGGSGGIGTAIVRKFSTHDYNIIYSYHKSNKSLEDIINTDDLPVSIHSCQLDVTDKSSIEKFSDFVDKTFSVVDCIVYCSGIVRDDSFITMTDEVFHSVLNTNLIGCRDVIKSLFLNLNFKSGASIVTVSSTGGIRPDAGQTNYAASKAGLIGLTECLAREYARKNIRANIVAPGFIDTDMVDTNNVKIQKSIGEIPLKRLGKPEEVADAVYFLGSDSSSYITAQTLVVDGGRL